MSTKAFQEDQHGALFYGDNLDVLRRYVDGESVDLVYLDPPFNSNADYNVLFLEPDGSWSASQKNAFEDTWRWDQGAARAFEEVVEAGGEVSNVMQAFRTILPESNMLAYLAMMAPRLVELRRVLKPTGSLYLHCDPSASHYLKLLLDAVFEPKNFRNEIIWRRTFAKGLTKTRLPSNHDVILAYQAGQGATWNLDAAFQPYDTENLDEKTAKKYRDTDSDGRRYQLTSLLNPNHDRPNLEYEFLGVTRVWRWTRERMQREYEAGRVVQTKPGAVPRYKRYLDEQRGRPFGDVWTDIPALNSRAAERLGYLTQKPAALLERIIELSTAPDAVVLDPFCGCGTTIAAAEKLNRRWIGIDVTFQATNLIKHRLLDAFGDTVPYTVVGEPTTTEDAKELAEEDRDQFEAWALGLVGARNAGKKKGPDRGIDGRLLFHEKPGGKTRQVLISVKSGKTSVADVRDLRGVIEREEAEIGLLITMREPTQPMRSEAAAAGFYRSGSEGVASWGDHPHIQLLTVAELLGGRRIDMPSPTGNLIFRRAPRVERRRPTTEPLFRNLSVPPKLEEMFQPAK
ncbi:MAG TPA: DNA methyltransferase [Solirubrobacterales bacterium]